MRILTHSLVVAAVVAAIAACGGSTGPAADVDPRTITYAASLGVDFSTMTKTADGLWYKDNVAGTGPTAAAGSRVTVRYDGHLPNGVDFVDPGPYVFSFTLGDGMVITGFDEGVRGMKVGGKRRLILPPSLAYGSAGSGPIPPNSVIVFDVEIVSIP
ncbi:MAG: FKBP-type peptidyl-prolyl cis-trans isomerase [Gemmatimonadaceae bacterium]